MSKHRPILFSTPMVQAILSGNKTQTRRTKGLELVNYNPNEWFLEHNKVSQEYFFFHKYIVDLMNNINCPFGKTGDILWVREEHYRFGRWIKNGETNLGRQKWKFEELDSEVRYSDTMNVLFFKSRSKTNPSSPYWYKRLARFMPKSAARIWLEITNVRVERLQDISWDDAKSEGIEPIKIDDYRTYYKRYVKADNGADMTLIPRTSFRTLWKSINGSESWQQNPFVWVVEFKRVNVINGNNISAAQAILIGSELNKKNENV